MTTSNTSIAVLLADPAIKAVMEKEVPGLEMRVGNELLRPHLNNFSPRSLVQFGVFDRASLDRVDEKLKVLPGRGYEK